MTLGSESRTWSLELRLGELARLVRIIRRRWISLWKSDSGAGAQSTGAVETRGIGEEREERGLYRTVGGVLERKGKKGREGEEGLELGEGERKRGGCRIAEVRAMAEVRESEGEMVREETKGSQTPSERETEMGREIVTPFKC